MHAIFINILFAYDLPIIDAHSQVDHTVDLNKIIKLMDKAGVSKTILSTRGKVKPKKLIKFYNNNKSKIIPAIRTKGNFYSKDTEKYYKILEKQSTMKGFGAMAEVIMWHAQKGNKAPKVVVHPDDKRVLKALDVVKSNNWPFIAHIEFRAAGSEKKLFMNKFKNMLSDNSDTAFILIHMGQLDLNEVSSLIDEFPNIYFITAHTNPISLNISKQPWTNMFEGSFFSGYYLNEKWEKLIIEHPDRFILGFDNVFKEHWGSFYLDQVALWRKVLDKLPLDVSKKFSYSNAQRLWNIKE